MKFKETETILKAIAEETRLEILSYLTYDTFCVCELVSFLNMSQPSISQHLKKLRQVDLIIEEKRAKWVYYSLNKRHDLYPLVLHLTNKLPQVNSEVDEKRICCGA